MVVPPLVDSVPLPSEDSAPLPVGQEQEESELLRQELESLRIRQEDFEKTEDLAETVRLQTEALELEREKLEKRKTELRSGGYRFFNRAVPVPPNASRSQNAESQIIQDSQSNSWRWIATEVQSEVFTQLASSLDVSGTEMDLDFVLLAVSEDGVNELGLTGLFRDGASFRTLGDLGFSTAGLSLGFKGVQLDFSAEKLLAHSRVVSAPFVRVLSGQEFRFESVDEVPVESTVVSDGISQTSFQFRRVGLRFNGTASAIASRASFELNVESGSVGDAGTNGVPSFRTDSSSVSGFLEWARWSLVAGLVVDSETERKGFLSRSSQSTSDLLLVFVRPRLNFPSETPPPLPSSPVGIGLKWADDPMLLPPFGDSSSDDFMRALPVFD